jgi:membrane protein required for colicin V production
MSGFNWVDYIFLIIFFISLLMGLSRGLIKEVLSLLTWIVSIIVASMFTHRLATWFTGTPQVQSAINNTSNTLGMNSAQPISMVSLAASFIILFIGSMIVCSIIASILSQVGNMPGISILNRLAGTVFGVARGFLINIIVVFLVELSPLSQEPSWTQSQLLPLFKPGAAIVTNLVQPGLQQLKSKVSNTIQNVGSQYLPAAN